MKSMVSSKNSLSRRVLYLVAFPFAAVQWLPVSVSACSWEEVSDPETSIDRLIANLDDGFRQAGAGSEKLASETLRKSAKQKDEAARRGVAGNANTAADMVLSLVGDPDEDVRAVTAPIKGPPPKYVG